MSLIKPSRRGFITGLVSLIAAPAIVRVANIMPVRSIIVPGFDSSFEAYTSLFQWQLDLVVEDWRYTVRLCNIDTTTAGLLGPTPPDSTIKSNKPTGALLDEQPSGVCELSRSPVFVLDLCHQD
jgi:hypothetical protein